jgi:hypothetical protein
MHTIGIRKNQAKTNSTEILSDSQQIQLQSSKLPTTSSRFHPPLNYFSHILHSLNRTSSPVIIFHFPKHSTRIIDNRLNVFHLTVDSFGLVPKINHSGWENDNRKDESCARSSTNRSFRLFFLPLLENCFSRNCYPATKTS